MYLMDITAVNHQAVRRLACGLQGLARWEVEGNLNVALGRNSKSSKLGGKCRRTDLQEWFRRPKLRTDSD